MNVPNSALVLLRHFVSIIINFQEKLIAIVVTITREQMQKLAALMLTFNAGTAVRSGALEVRDYISFKYIEPEAESNVGLIAGASVGKE